MKALLFFFRIKNVSSFGALLSRVACAVEKIVKAKSNLEKPNWHSRKHYQNQNSRV
jgi:hypothetical protein